MNDIASQDRMPMQSYFGFGMNLLEGCDIRQPHPFSFAFDPASR